MMLLYNGYILNDEEYMSTTRRMQNPRTNVTDELW
jgi:hypothetical protein